MSTCAFDVLLDALREAVMAADIALGLRREASRSHDDDDACALHVEVPESPDIDAPLQPVIIPLRLFRDRRMPHLALMSIEFDGRFRFRRRSGHVRPELVIDIGKPRFRWFARGSNHRIRISYRPADAWQPHVEIDGRAVALPTTHMQET